MRTTSTILLACVLALSACNSPPAATDAGGLDSGAADSGPRADGGRDAGRRDGGTPPDPCAVDDDPASTVGCNGALLGADRPDNDFGGTCTASDTAVAGTCTGTGAVCWGEPGQTGICVATCTPTADAYVSTGGCPSGSRCFQLSSSALCFPDCGAASDCATANCDGEGSCVQPVPAPEDGGVPADGGVLTDGGVAIDDGGGIDDGGVSADDGGAAPDAGP